jgi:hypothetical protein
MTPDKPPRKPIPIIIWVGLGFVVMLLFLFALRTLNPPSPGMGPAMPDVVVPKGSTAAP